MRQLELEMVDRGVEMESFSSSGDEVIVDEELDSVNDLGLDTGCREGAL